MELVRPENRIGNQEIADAWAAVIIDQRSPVGMSSLPGILMLIDTASVKTGQPVDIPGEMGRNPVQDHANPLSVHIIHKIHKIIRRAVPAGGCIISRHLIAPGGIQRMLHHREKLDMGIAHLLHILRQLHGNLPVIIKFGACHLGAVLID